jgi:hypothetical protein
MSRKKKRQTLKTATTAELEDLRVRHRALVARMDAQGLEADDLYRLFADKLGQAVAEELTRREQDTSPPQAA